MTINSIHSVPTVLYSASPKRYCPLLCDWNTNVNLKEFEERNTCRIAVIGATGKAGKLIVQEAVNRSHEVTAISRRPHPNTPAQHTLVKNVTDLTTTDFKAVDVVISALGSQQIVELTTHLGQILSGTDTRLVVIGGTGTLYTTPARTERLVDSPNFPAEYRKYAEAHAAASASLRGITG